MPDVERIGPEEARRRVQAGEALLACAYDDEAKCSSMRLEGATTINDLRPRLAALPRSQEIILYCA